MVGTDLPRIHQAPLPNRRRQRWLHISIGALLVIALIAFGLFLSYRRQVISYVTHRKGGPSSTVAYERLAEPSVTHLAAAGDIGDSGKRLTATALALSAIGDDTPFDALMLLGDNVYPDGDPARLPATVFEPFAPLLGQGTQLLAILGNHDVHKGNGDA